MFQYRVTKYDPAHRNKSGHYTRDDWTSFGDIGLELSPRVALGLGILCVALFACRGGPQPTDGEPTSWSGYPEEVVPCLDAMRELPFATGENLRGVTDSDGTCAISISFESQRDLDAFREQRRIAGDDPGAVDHRLPDGSMQRIALELRVGEGTVPHRPPQSSRVAEVDLSQFFVGMEGTFVLLDARQGLTRVYNPARAERRFLPASTFKIANSLIALETGVADGPDFALAWDPLETVPQDWWPRSWRRDQTLRSAFQNSVYWFYQEVARRVGEERMQTYLHQFDYGNQDLGGGLDQFWLHGDLRISPLEQVDFLQRFYTGALGVSERTRQIVKDIMVLEEGPSYRLGGKTGTAELTSTRELGWLVGYLERGESVFFFALNMEGERVWEDWPPHKRMDLVRQILATLEVLPRSHP